ncbi:MAG: DUF3830 family protein [Clostridiales bacterium]|nr:DUF3830 family protein [Clostridiales bacterium]
MQKVELKSGEYRFIGVLEEKNAPKTCEAFIKMLPLKEKVIHVRWSGEAVWIPYGDQNAEIPHENATSYPNKGEVLFYPGGVSEMEIIFAYGACCFSSKAGQLAGNHFLTLTGDMERWYEFGRKALIEGAQDVAISIISEESKER